MQPLTSEDINKAILALPCLPSIVIELIHVLDKEDVDMHTLAH